MFFMVGQTDGNSLAFLYFFLYGSAGGSNAALRAVLMRLCGLSNAVLWFFWRLFPCFLCGFAGAALRVSVGAVRMACDLEKNTQRDIFLLLKFG